MKFSFGIWRRDDGSYNRSILSSSLASFVIRVWSLSWLAVLCLSFLCLVLPSEGGGRDSYRNPRISRHEGGVTSIKHVSEPMVDTHISVRVSYCRRGVYLFLSVKQLTSFMQHARPSAQRWHVPPRCFLRRKSKQFCIALVWLLRPMQMTSHVLRVKNMNVLVTSCFASHSLLRAMWMTFHVLRISNMNVVVPLCFASHSWLCAK